MSEEEPEEIGNSQEMPIDNKGSQGDLPPTASEEKKEEEPSEAQTQDLSSPKDEDRQDRNFRRLREEKTRLERENREYQAYLKKLVEQSQAKETPPDEDSEPSPDDIPEWKDVRKHSKKIAAEEVERLWAQKELQNVPGRLKSTFPDFESVVTQENVETLKEEEPEIFAVISSGNDLYSKGVAAYKLLKSTGIHKGDPYMKEKRKAVENSLKPKSSNSIRKSSPLHDIAMANDRKLSPDLMQKFRKEMAEAKKRS